MSRVFSGIQPTGDLHLGNLLGAVRNWVVEQHDADSFYCIVDLHALTVPKAPGEVGRKSLELAQVLIACGLDPEVCTLFVQSHVREHSELSWLIQCVTSMGELRRMTQFKDKSERQDFISAGLFTYPALQAADILLYDTDRVPVGEDQRQHIELTRDVAERFNARYGDTFVMPVATIPAAGARVMDLQVPTDKMSKSAASDAGTVMVDEDLASVAKKFKRAVTDSDGEVRYDVAGKPGVSNLLSILGAVTGRSPEAVAEQYSQYGPLKADTAEAVVEMLRPIQTRLAELRSDPALTASLLATGATKARAVAGPVVARAKDHIGLLPAD
ncbi:MAG: tryptophan--tRNA ligase [Actinomycetota bacterium]|nr:tryptophan--tRNA ligase [Actinomycetota bacterium]